MLADYGYKDASGDFFITIDTNRCNGCGACLSACPEGIFQVVDADPNDLFREVPVAVVAGDKSKKLKYECAGCKTAEKRPLLPCVSSCKTHAIGHSW